MITKYKIRVQIIATADDNGSNAANISASTIAGYLNTVTQVFAPANVEFVFDQTDDFLKINSTLLNRDFTLLELPNVDDDKWDHKPLTDSESHTRARTNLCKQFGGKLVVIYRNRKKLVEENGVWKIVTKNGGSSGASALFVNMSTSSAAQDLAHEIGHYLQLPHPFSSGVETVAEAAAKIKSYVESGHDKDEGLDALDGDRNVLLDTPADCKGKIFENENLEVCGDIGEISIPVEFGNNSISTYTLKPDRNLIMSYFKGCPGDKTITEQQARRVRDGLELRHRHDLISVKPSFSFRIKRGATETGGAISQIDTTLVRAGRVATAVRDGDGKVRVIVWDIEDSGNKITRRGTGIGGAINKVSTCGLGANMVATAVLTSADELKIIIWRIEENGDVTRVGEASAAGQITDVAVCLARYDMGANFMATAVRRADGTLKVDVWKTYANGKLDHQASASAGKINIQKSGLNTPRLTISNAGTQSLVTYIRDENNDFKTILWEFEGNNLARLGSIALDAPSIGSISACNVAREVTVAAIQDKDKKLKLIAYTFPENGKFMTQRGTVAAGSIGDVDICRLGMEMVMTGVRIGEDKLKLILWRVTKNGDYIIRLDDAATNEVFSRLSMCYTDRNQLATALRDGDGKLKIIVWRNEGNSFGSIDNDSFTKLIENAPLAETLQQEKINLARGGECEVEDS